MLEVKKVEKQRETFVYLGRDIYRGLPAFKLENMIVGAIPGAGLEAFMDNFIAEVVLRSKPDELKLTIWSSEHTVWENAIKDNRKLPHIDEVVVDTKFPCTESLQRFTNSIIEEIDKRGTNKDKVYSNMLNIISLTDVKAYMNGSVESKDAFKKNLEYILLHGKSVGVYIMFLHNNSIQNLAGLFPIKISLRNTEEASRELLGCDIAFTDDTEKCGVAWIKNKHMAVPEKLWFSFKPSYYYNKLIKLFSVPVEEIAGNKRFRV